MVIRHPVDGSRRDVAAGVFTAEVGDRHTSVPVSALRAHHLKPDVVTLLAVLVHDGSFELFLRAVDFDAAARVLVGLPVMRLHLVVVVRRRLAPFDGRIDISERELLPVHHQHAVFSSLVSIHC